VSNSWISVWSARTIFPMREFADSRASDVIDLLYQGNLTCAA
jgi:hypothetical protein